jgi:hypothetical protein
MSSSKVPGDDSCPPTRARSLPSRGWLDEYVWPPRLQDVWSLDALQSVTANNGSPCVRHPAFCEVILEPWNDESGFIVRTGASDRITVRSAAFKDYALRKSFR